MTTRTDEILELLAVAGPQTCNQLGESLGYSERDELQSLNAMLYYMEKREFIKRAGTAVVDGARPQITWAIAKAGSARISAPIDVSKAATAKPVRGRPRKRAQANLAATTTMPAAPVPPNGAGASLRIERGIPIPGLNRRASQLEGTITQMQVGDSVVLGDTHGASHFLRVMRKHGLKGTQRLQPDSSVRVWRTA